MDVALVLHTHLPRLARNGAFPVGEQWLHEAVTESYLPVLEVLERLASAGHRDLATVGVTPVLAEQLADPYVIDELRGWTGRRLIDLQWTIGRYGATDRGRLHGAWRHEWRRWQRTHELVEGRVRRDGLVRPFATLAETGVIELLGGPATHPYLPLHADLDRARAQLADGLTAHRARFGLAARGMWPPELGYRPAGDVDDPARVAVGRQSDGSLRLPGKGVDLPGLEALWEEVGIDHVVLDGPTLAEGAGAAPRDWSRVGATLPAPGWSLDAVDGPVRIGTSDVLAFGRNLPVSYAVWSPVGGYPADPAYRDFHARDLEGGFKTWRVTGPRFAGDDGRAAGGKEPYDPVAARERAIAHADEFLRLLRRYAEGRDGIVVAAYDTELFGHWWHEGPVWLERVLRGLVDDPTLRPTSLAGHLGRGAAAPRLDLPESSWGAGKRHAAWATPETRDLWERVEDAQRAFAGVPGGRRREVCARQLELLEASDWPFMVSHGTTARYGRQRALTHHARFASALRGEALPELEHVDGPPVARAAGAAGSQPSSGSPGMD
ncbi:DUF1957 domain-containing protein [Egibacter rhizosphaerae]|uniref:DUF1957 domain-containing protein n=1 Tax=Egibacter rhizosphaerae TaxID=1670831 RepID=A0A411YD02_9ACTN|nr:1,4-alpha-glucan branching protein domain-containing protein [Egibacter rhizosphaerae]QBI19055.1 DUF1957 domain-containing protein [Egibacter rhizosphaerae]